MEMGELSAEVVESIVNQAEERATLAEVAAADERRKQRELEKTASPADDGDGEAVTSQVPDSEDPVSRDESSHAESVGADGSEASGGETS